MALRSARGRARCVPAILLLLGLAACRPAPQSPHTPSPADPKVAVVDGRSLHLSDVRREALAQGLLAAGERLEPGSALYRQMLQEVVDRALLAGEARRSGLDDDAEVQKRLRAASERVLADAAVEAAIRGAVTEAAVQTLYQERLKLAGNLGEARLRLVVLADPKAARDLMGEIRSGADMEALARARSLDRATGARGGDLGYAPLQTLAVAYGRAVLTATPGQLLGPVQTPSGWAVARVEETREAPAPSIEAVRPEIVRFLTYDRVRDLVEKLRAHAKIEYEAPAALQPSPPSTRPAL